MSGKSKQKPFANVPPLIVDGLRSYVLDRVETGGFLRAVLENDLAGAICRADASSLTAIRDIVLYVHNCLPSECHGSGEVVNAWLKRRSAI